MSQKKDLSFPATRRLRKRPEFLHVSRVGERVATRHFLLIVAPSSQKSVRIGITASKKVGNSVVRSRAKRVVREAFRHCTDCFPSGTDIVVICRNKVQELSPEQALIEWRAAQGRIRKAHKKALEKSLRSSSSDSPTSRANSESYSNAVVRRPP